MSEGRDDGIARLAVELGLVDQAAIEAARAKLEERLRSGEDTSFERILVQDLGLLSDSQLREILGTLPPRDLVCTGEGCGRRYRIRGFDPKRVYHCKACGEFLTVVDAEPREPTAVTAATPEEETQVPDAWRADSRDHFEILEVLGRAGQGIVYLARDPDLRRQVAVKCLKLPYPARSSTAQRFVREARLNGQLEHPNIVPVYEMGLRADGSQYLAMKLVRGRTLEAVLDELRRQTKRQRDARALVEARGRLLRDFLKVSEAVAYAHSRGVIHRDLKPSNVMIGEFGEVQVMDWGIARVVSSELSNDLGLQGEPPPIPHDEVDVGEARGTEASLAYGTPTYMPPEQFDGDPAEIGPASDVYSLGAVLYEILTLTRPYPGKTASELALQHLAGRLEPPSRRRPDAAIPRELDAVVARAMRPLREERYHSVTELADDVECFLSGHAVSAAQHSIAELLVKWARRNRTKVAGAAATLLAIAAGAIGIWFAAGRAARTAREDELARRRREAEALYASGESSWSRAGAKFPEFHPAIEQAFFQAHLAALLAMARGLQTHPDAPEIWRGAVAERARELQERAQEAGNWALARVLAESVDIWGAATGEREARVAMVEKAEGEALAEEVRLLDEAIGRIEAAESSAGGERGQRRLIPGEIEERARRIAGRTSPGLADEALARLESAEAVPRSPAARRFLVELLGRIAGPWTRAREARAASRIVQALSDPPSSEDLVSWIRAAARFESRHPGSLDGLEALLGSLRVRRDQVVVQAVGEAQDLLALTLRAGPLVPPTRDREGFRRQVEALADLALARVRSGTAYTRALLERCESLEPGPTGRFLFLFDQLGLGGDRFPPDLDRPDRSAPRILTCALEQLPETWLPDEPPPDADRRRWERTRAIAIAAAANLSRLEDSGLAELLRARRTSSGRLFDAATEIAYGLLPLALLGEPGTAMDFEARGRARLAGRDLAGAIEDFSRAIELEPGRALFHNQRGLARFESGQLPEAVTDFTTAIGLDPDLAQPLVNRGHVRYLLGDLAGAIEDCTRAIEIDSTMGAAYTNRGIARWKSGDLAGARGDFSRAIEIDPQDATAFNNRAMIQSELGGKKDALEDLTRALEIDPRYIDALANRGSLRIDLDDLDGAIADLGRAIDLDPSFVAAWLNRGVARKEKGDLEGAIRDYDRALELDPGEATAWCNRGIARRASGDLEGAIADFTEAISRRADYAQAFHNRGLARRDGGDFGAAIQDLDRAIELEPRPARYNDRGTIRRRAGDHQGAIADYSRAIELSPGHAIAHLNRGNAQYDLGDWNAAFADHDAAVGLDPTLWEAWFMRGVSLARLGRNDDAAESFRQALERCPPEKREHVVNTRQKLLGR